MMTPKQLAELTKLERGEYLILRTDGKIERTEEKPHYHRLCSELGIMGAVDTVTITRHAGRSCVVMIVDDTGLLDRKPANEIATQLYHGVCKPGTVFEIHGDVALVRDSDFE